MKFVSKFKNQIKKIEGLSHDSSPPSFWFSSGSYVLNRALTGDFKRAFGQGRVFGICGPSGCLPEDQTVEVYVMKTVDFDLPIKDEQNSTSFLPTSISITSSQKLKELCEYDNCSINENDIDKLFNSHCKKHATRQKITDIKNYDKLVMVNTPDGFQPIIQFFNKKERFIYGISTNDFNLRCSEDHLIETQNGWKYAKDISIGENVLTENGFQSVVSLEKQQKEKVYDFEVGHANHRYYAEGISSHNSGKSFLLSNIMREAQKELNAFVYAVDSENALDESFVSKIGVDVSEENFLYTGVITIPHVKKVTSEFIKMYREEGETRPTIIAIDSLGMLLTDSEFDQLERGEAKGDQGQRAKQTKALLKGLVHAIKDLNIVVFVTDQVYQATQDNILNGTSDGLWVVNGAVKYSLSNLLLLSKSKMKGTSMSDIIGINMKCEVIKTRFTKPFQKVVIDVPYETGMDKYSGFRDVMLELDVLQAKGSWNVIKSTGDQFYWKDFNEERAQQMLRDAEAKADIAIGSHITDEDTEIPNSTEDTLKKKRIKNYLQFVESNPDYTPEGTIETEED